MSHELLISRMRLHRGPEVRSLDEFFAHSGEEVFNRMNDVARQSPQVVDDAAVEWAVGRIGDSPGSVFALLLNIAWKDEERRERMIARYRSLMEAHPKPALACAGYNLHEFHPLLDAQWLADADRLFDHDPDGAWGIFESAAMYEQEFITPALIEAFERRRAAMPRDYFVSLLSLAPRRPELLARVLKAFPDHPAEAVDGTSFAARSEAERVPIGQAHLMHTLASLVPADAIVVDESATSLPFVLRYMPFATPGSFFGGKTGTLGWGMGAAIGVQLGSPGRKVVATIGDGSVMYAPQALWTAAHYRLPITYVVPNNSSYAILKSGMLSLDLASAKRGIYPGMDLVSPEIDYAGLARSLGVRAERVEKPGELRDVLAACLAGPGPSLVDVAIDRGFKPML